MGIAGKAARGAKRIGRAGPKKTITPARAAQIQRWQMLGAAARKGSGKAKRAGHHNKLAAERKSVASTYAAAAKWGVTRLLVPTSMVSGAVPGYQPGDKTKATPKRKRG